MGWIFGFSPGLPRLDWSFRVDGIQISEDFGGSFQVWSPPYLDFKRLRVGFGWSGAGSQCRGRTGFSRFSRLDFKTGSLDFQPGFLDVKTGLFEFPGLPGTILETFWVENLVKV